MGKSPNKAIDTGSKLTFSTKVAYGSGDFASQLVWTLSSSYLLIFYTDVAGLSAIGISAILLIARVWDAIMDPVIGAVAERTKSKHGRFRPYILYGTPILALFSVLTFTSPSFGGNMTAKLIWAVVTYLGMGMCYSAVNLPYGSLSTVMTKNSNERTMLVNFRQVGSVCGGIAVNALALPLINYFSGGKATATKLSYTLTALIFTAVAVPVFYFMFYKCREVVQPLATGKKIPIKDSIKSCLNRPLMCIFAINFFALLAMFGRMGVVLYYYKYVMKDTSVAALLMTIQSVAMAIGIMLFSRFTKYVGKKNMMYISFALQALILVAIYFIDYSNTALIITFTILYGMAGIGFPVAMAIIPDAIDYAEDKTGIRADGIAYAVFSLGTKLASAIGGAVGILLISAAGYVANRSQTPGAMRGISFVVNILPAICLVAAIVFVIIYNIPEEKAAQIRASLDRKEKALLAAENQTEEDTNNYVR